MKLRDCKYGVLVQCREGRIGMIKGITNNAHLADVNVRNEKERAIPLVEWANGTTSGIHYNHLTLFKEF